jgi:hypothetical protein
MAQKVVHTVDFGPYELFEIWIADEWRIGRASIDKTLCPEPAVPAPGSSIGTYVTLK